MASTQEIVATGRRKTSVARVRMTAGSGKIDINGRSFEEYFPTAPLQNTVLQPLQTVKLANAYDISINATGGGATGQAGAVRLAISRALLQVDINLRATLKADDFLRSFMRGSRRSKTSALSVARRLISTFNRARENAKRTSPALPVAPPPAALIVMT